MIEFSVEREFDSDLHAIYVLSNEEARQLFFNLAARLWPELHEKNVLRLLANDALTKRNAELERELAMANQECALAGADLAGQRQRINELGEENTRLKAELHLWEECAEHTGLRLGPREAMEDIDQLRAELAEARRDAERLDFCQANSADLVAIGPSETVSYSISWWRNDEKFYLAGFKSWRAAIDDAIAGRVGK